MRPSSRFPRYLEWSEKQADPPTPEAAFIEGWNLGWKLLDDHRESRIKELEHNQGEAAVLVTRLYDMFGRADA